MDSKQYILPSDLVSSSRSDLNGNIISVNSGFLESTGYSEQEVLGKEHSILRHPDVPKEVFIDLWKTLKLELPWFGVLKNVRKNGDFYWVSINIVPVFEQGMVTSYVSVRYPASEDQIFEAEAYYFKLKNHTVTPRQENPFNSNVILYELMGFISLFYISYQLITIDYSLINLVFVVIALIGLGHTFFLWLRENFFFPIVLRKGIEDLCNGNFSKPINNSSYTGVLLNIVRARLAELEAKNYDIRKQRDLLKRVEIEHQVHQKFVDQLVMQSRHSVMGEMLAIISHQWRQPLAVSMLNVEIVTMKIKLLSLSDTEKTFLLERLSLVRDMLMDKSHLLDEFTDFFKPDRKLESFSVLPSVNSALSMFESALSLHCIGIVREINVNCQLFGSEREFRQIIVNIVKNAIEQFVENNIHHPIIHIKLIKKKDAVVMEISDNGGGIPKEILPKMFDAYQSTKSLNGTGLGLYMVKMIMTEHFIGHVIARNSNEGAVFELNFPDNI